MDGINVALVERSYNQTRFQCFAPSGNGLQVEASDVATLTVTENSKLLYYTDTCMLTAFFLT